MLCSRSENRCHIISKRVRQLGLVIETGVVCLLFIYYLSYIYFFVCCCFLLFFVYFLVRDFD